MKHASLVLAAVLWLSPSSQAQEKPVVLDVWPGKVPGETGKIGDEKLLDPNPKDKKAVMRLTNVSKPTITIFRPKKDKDTGAAVVICPGGGYNILAWDLEGEEVAAWLNSIGVTGIVLKYRVPRRPGDAKDKPPIGPLQDAQRAMSLVRSKASEWNIDAKRIGILGFSAGGHLAAATSTNYDKRAYESMDDVDKVSCRPDFAVLVYPAYLTAKRVAERGVDLVVLAKDQPLQLPSDLDEKIGERIAKIPAVKAVDFSLSDYVSVPKGQAKGEEVRIIVQGWRHDSFMMDKFRFVSGRKFKEGEKGVALLGNRQADILKKKVGDNVTIEGESLKVIGIFEGPTGFENSFLVMPLPELQRMKLRKGRVTGFSVILKNGDEKQVKAAKEAIEGLQNEKGESLRLAAEPISRYLDKYGFADDDLAADIRVTKDSPRTFFAHASNDGVKSDNSVQMYLALKRAGVAAELHIYATGGHGFGLRASNQPCSTWPERCGEWLRNQGLLKQP
jgi:acetyl esterase/lipase